MDVKTDRTDVDGRTSEWLTLAQAAAVLGKTERTLRRYASGEIRTPPGLEISSRDGRVMVRVTDRTGQKTDARAPKTESLEELEATRRILQEKEILVARLEAALGGKEELLQAKESQIEDLRKSRDKDHQSIDHLEILLSQVQKALPAPKGRRTAPIGTDFDSPERRLEPKSRRRLWLWIALAVVVLAGGGAALAWYLGWLKPA